MDVADARVAIDLGQTQARLRLMTSAGARDLTTGGHVPGRGRDDTIADVVAQAVAAGGLSRVDTVTVGMTGVFGRVEDVAGIAAVLRDRWATRRVIVADDAVTTYLGAVPDGATASGAVVAAVGTGFVALGVGPAGVVRVDGVGSHLGDEGAGWWIGRQGLIAAFSSADGREGGSDDLRRAAERRFGALAGIPQEVAQASSPIAVVAGFARDVADVARAGDSVARRIWDRAGRHIGAGVVAAAVRSGNTAQLSYALAGRIAEAHDLVDAAVERELENAGLSGNRFAPAGRGLDGAEALAWLAEPHRFRELIAVSSTEAEQR